MSDTATSSLPGVAPKNLIGRLVGVILSPGETFRSVVAYPGWLGALLVVVLVTAGAQFALLSTEVGQRALLDQQIRSSEAWGRTVTAEQEAQMERMLPVMRFITAGTILLMSPLVTFVLAGVLLGVFNAVLGGDASYKQVLAVVTHAGAVSVVGTLFTIPLSYAKESLSGTTNLAVFLPFLDEGSLVARFLGMIDLFLVWWVIVLGVGLAVLYKRRASPVAWSLMGAYVAIAAVIAVVMRAFAGGE